MLGCPTVTIRARRIVVSLGLVVLSTAVGGCDTAASFCSIMRRPHAEFRSSGATDSERRRQIRSLNEIIGELPRGTQRDDVVAVRDYVEVLFGVKTYRSQADQDQDQRKAVQRFFGGASQDRKSVV